MKSNKPLAERLVALLLAGVTALSSVPTAALAQAVEEMAPQAASTEGAGDEEASDGAVSADDGEQGKASDAITDAAENTEGTAAADQAGAESTSGAADAATKPEAGQTGSAGSKDASSDQASVAENAPAADSKDAGAGKSSAADEAPADESAPDDADIAAAATESAAAAPADASDAVALTSANDAKVSVSFQLIGVSADGTDEAWVTKTYQVEKGSTADALIEQALSDANLAHTSSTTQYGYYLSDITSADGRTLGWDSATGNYWQLFVDGAASSVGASSVQLSAGTSILLYYSSYGVKTQSVSLSIIGPDDAGSDSCWVSSADYEFVDGATAADAIEQTLVGAGLEHVSSTTQYGYYLESITRNGKTYGYDAETGKYWQLFVNGKASEVGASSVVLSDGDRIQLVYSSYGDVAEAKASVQVIGLDSAGMPESWATSEYSFERGEATAADATEALFASAGMTADYGDSSWGWSLNSITHDGETYAYDSATGNYWQLFINGTASSVMADGYVLQPGDKIVWAYSCGDEVPEPGAQSAEASVELIGLDSNGNAARWGTLSGWKFEAGATVADLSEAFIKSSGITADYGETTWGWSLNSVTSPYDSSIVLSSAQDSGGNWHYWQLFVNGVAATSYASGITLKNGDSVQWCYCAYGDDPSSSTIVDPGAKGPDWDSDWSGYTTANKVTDAATPTKDAEAKWVSELKKSTDWSTYYSDPVLAGDYLYVAVGSTLYKKNVDTGETVAGGTADLADKVDSVSRIVYTDGLILIPLSCGRLQAVTADTMVTKWVTSALPNGKNGKLQSLSAVTVSDGYAYFGATDASWTGSDGGYLLCVRISDGKVMWSRANENSTGYYWAGMAFSGDYGVIGDDAGNVCSIDPATGDVVSTYKVSSSVRSTVLTDGSFAYVVSNDGYLHKLSVASDGTLSEVGSVQFGASSTSTPVLANGKIYVGGTSIEGSPSPWSSTYVYHYGQIAVIDAETMTVEYTIDKAGGSYIRQQNYSGDVKSQPVVSIQDGKTYVYFTSNNNPGCIYRYCVGDDEAEVLYTPEADGQQYCMSSIAVGSDGALYYTNDSGKLFAVKGNGKRAQRYIVSFDLNGGTGETPAPQKVKEGATAIQPATPVRAGYKFCGWYTDAACTSAWDFSQGVEGNMMLTAKWEKVKKDDSGGDSGSGSGTTPSGTDPATQPGSDPAPQPGAGTDSGTGSGSGISISGNGNGSSSGSSSATTVAASLAGTLKSTTAAVVETATEEASAESLLTGFASEQMSATTSAGSAAAGNSGASANSGAASANVGSAAASRGLPIWPFIGMGAGIAALIAALVAKRKKEDEQ